VALDSSDRSGESLRAELDAAIGGEVLLPSDEGYDEARAVWNGRFDRRPAVIARCNSTADVAAAVRFARAKELPISVKSGGHDYAGNTVGEGGLLVDLASMRGVEVDPVGRRATAEPGATWRDVDEATQKHGLATPGGSVSSVGVAGFTLGGGAGWLTRKHGLAIDNLVAAEVVTAEGDVVRASEQENADLLWALRGGGGNFGIVTRFEYALHEVGPEVYAGQVIYPAERATELLRFFRDHMRDAPDDLMAFFFFLRVPPLEFFPEEHHGALAVDFVLTWLGPVEDGEAALAPFRALGEPIFDMVGPQPYLTLQQSFDEGMSAKGGRWYSRYHYLDGLTDAAIDTIVEGLKPFPGEFTTVYLADEGGAPGRIAVDATAFPHRTAGCSIHVFPGWVDSEADDRIMQWARGLGAAIAGHSNGGVYVNMLAEDERERVRAAYGVNYERLAGLKAKWDPGNVFRMNHNVLPESG
jgi:FAD/FMN-containing dehydrogenase